MIRILQVIAGMNAGGMENMIMNYYRNLDRKIIQFDFLIFTEGEAFFEKEILSLGGKIYKITSRRKNFIKNRIELKQFFVKYAQNYDIAEFHQGITYYYPLKMAKRYGVKARIIHNHGIDRKFLKYLKIYNEFFAKRRISNLATHYFSCSEDVNNQLFSNKILKRKKIQIIPNAIDVEKFRYSKEKANKIKKELSINEDIYVFGHIGTFTYPKNHNFIIQQYSELCKKRNNCILLLVGEGPLKKQIENKVRTLDIEDRVIFLGVRKDISDILSSIDTLIFPSLFEGIPLTLIESQAAGVKLLLSDNISQKIKCTNLCRFISLAANDEWQKFLMDFQKNEDREKYNEQVKETNYNINKMALKLQKSYISIVKGEEGC